MVLFLTMSIAKKLRYMKDDLDRQSWAVFVYVALIAAVLCAIAQFIPDSDRAEFKDVTPSIFSGADRIDEQ